MYVSYLLISIYNLKSLPLGEDFLFFGERMNESELLKLIVVLPWVLFLSLIGGLAAFITRLNNATTPKPLGKIFLSLLGELVLSLFAGLITFLICRHWQTEEVLTAVWVALSGHMGGNAVDKMIKFANNKIDKFTGGQK